MVSHVKYIEDKMYTSLTHCSIYNVIPRSDLANMEYWSLYKLEIRFQLWMDYFKCLRTESRVISFWSLRSSSSWTTVLRVEASNVRWKTYVHNAINASRDAVDGRKRRRLKKNSSRSSCYTYITLYTIRRPNISPPQSSVSDLCLKTVFASYLPWGPWSIEIW